MKVEGPGSLRNSGAAKRTGRSDGSLASAFARALHGTDDAAASGVNGAQAAGAVNPLLNLQEVEDSTSGPSKAKARAEELLDRLDEIRHALLSGGLPESKLNALQQVAQSHRAEVDDPRLVEILDEIDLRAQVELAKLSPRG
ncbi:flagellar assembly protein FliX [Skermanella rosea]|uniref:flagellar assembly protein FliX n=1 Tax=Skermanella rosea TaxID=1817965 RepID=UPI001932770E|nr:flagellar assembly protein FliX [Skermanella rosea]UEM04261.1 flagellar assembly protein FliX [Skermanella rosea]